MDSGSHWVGDVKQINHVTLQFVKQKRALIPRQVDGRVVVDLVKPRRWGLRPKYIKRDYAEGKQYSDACTAAMSRSQRES